MNEFWNDLQDTFGVVGASADDARWQAIVDMKRFSRETADKLLPGLTAEQAALFRAYQEHQAELLAHTAQEKFKAGVRFGLQLLLACGPEQ